jgi:hypothetical protein
METNNVGTSGDHVADYLNLERQSQEVLVVNDSGIGLELESNHLLTEVSDYTKVDFGQSDGDVAFAITSRLQLLQREMSELAVALKFFDAYLIKKESKRS